MFESDEQIFDEGKKIVFSRSSNSYFKEYPRLSDFNQIKYISKGAFGKVYLYFHKETKKKFVIKTMVYEDEDTLQRESNIWNIKQQIQMLYKIDCPYIVRLYDHFEDDVNAYLIMENIDGMNLFDEFYKSKKQLSFSVICSIIDEICIGLEYLHEKGIVHRDLKLENILISNGKIKIIDLGESNHYGQNYSRKTTRGTKTYFAPEILFKEQQDDRLDVWCLGVILYELVCLKPPFTDITPAKVQQNIRRIKYNIPERIKQQKELLDLFQKIFAYKNQRIRINDVRNHPFMKKEEERMLDMESLLGEKKIIEYREYLEGEVKRHRDAVQEILKENQEIQKLIQKAKKQIEEGEIWGEENKSMFMQSY